MKKIENKTKPMEMANSYISMDKSMKVNELIIKNMDKELKSGLVRQIIEGLIVMDKKMVLLLFLLLF